ncbi:GNAT family N-acetyltransferase [Hoeflea olei]|uniref:N-acetyltransferase domain-containing protein n=1 Tax=Hoeflea olei TaxID=1480615 RepID=A0A1C1Z1D4_9HYPH|nr:GNAT family N-acetyltransferase [Hoeflea olei]OCW59561.1 hypothetical protein AWJ14_11165 [Hoeflea olei]
MAGSQADPADGLRIRRLSCEDLAQFAPLLSAYRLEMDPNTPPESRELEAATALLSSPVAEVMGGFLDETLSALAVVFDLPEAIANGRAGQLDDLYVAPRVRGRRLAQRMIEAVAGIGRARGWVHLRWLVPENNAAALRTYQRFAHPAPWKSYVVWPGNGAA